jgi:cysteine protease ATG4
MLQVYVTDDNSDVYQDKFMSVSRNDQGIVCPTLILLGLRLGIDRVTNVYWDGLKTMLQFPQSVGIAG